MTEELVVIDRRFFQSTKEDSDKRISDYLLKNFNLITWLAFNLNFYDEVKDEIYYSLFSYILEVYERFIISTNFASF